MRVEINHPIFRHVRRIRVRVDEILDTTSRLSSKIGAAFFVFPRSTHKLQDRILRIVDFYFRKMIVQPIHTHRWPEHCGNY